jgi:hypothetical protein
METPLAIALTILVLFLGLGLFLVILQSMDKTFYLYYLSSSIFFLAAAAAAGVSVIGLAAGIWKLPAIFLSVVLVMLGALLWSIASEERTISRIKKRRAPISATDVEKGLDWRALEKWLSKHGQEKKN